MKKSIYAVVMASLFFVSCSKDEKTDETAIEEEQVTPQISTFEDVALKLVDSDDDTYGVAFSATTGETFKTSEVDAAALEKIDLVSSTLQAFIAFESPNDTDEIPNSENGRNTKIQPTDVTMTVEDFDAITDASALSNLSVVHNKEAQPITFRGIILFETADRKVGAIKIKAINAERILFDVKVEK